MIIEKIHINSFGTLRSFDADFSDGLNIIEGVNESGKTAIAMFIKFIFYGLSGRSSDTALSEKKRFVNWDTGEASGSLVLRCPRGHFRIERALYLTTRAEDPGKETSREALRIVDAETNMPVLKGESPADVFLGVSEDVFLNTVFVRQLASAKVDGSDVQTAVENMLYSADENVNTDKAIDKLDKARKALLHKNENGGEIYELKRERIALTAALADAQSRGSETLETEAALTDAKIKLAKLEDELSSLENLSRAYAVVSGKNKLDAMHAAEIKLDDLKKQVDEHATSPASAEFYSDIVSTANELKETKERITELENEAETCSARLGEYDNITVDEEESDDGESTFSRYAYSLSSKKKHGIVLAVILLLFASIFSASCLLFPMLKPYSLYVIPGAAVLAVLGIVFIIRAAVAGSKLKAIIADWDTDGTGDIEDAIAEYDRMVEEKRELTNETNDIAESLTDARSAVRILLTRLKTMCSSLGVPEADDTDSMVEAALTVCESITKERDDARREHDTVTGRLAILTEQLASCDPEKLTEEYEQVIATPEGRQALALSPSAAADIDRARAFKNGAARSQTEKTHELETKLSALRASSPDPAIISAKLDVTAEKLAKLEKQHAAYVLAINSLTEATENLRSGILPKITHRACGIMALLSEGKYKTVGVGSDFGMSFSAYGMTREIDYLSAGTCDIAYISLRIALVETLFEKEMIPSIFDESFARIDESRLAALLGMLNTRSGMQSFVFTCRSLEGKIAESLAGSKLTKIPTH